MRPEVSAPGVSDRAYWAEPVAAVAAALSCSPRGLDAADAIERLQRFGPNVLSDRQGVSRPQLLIAQLRNPLLIVLFVAAVLSALTADWTDSLLVLGIVIATVGIGYSREHNAHSALKALQARVRTTALAVRDGAPQSVPVQAVVPGDLVLLSAGSLVPGDGVLVEATDLYVAEAILTGESFPVLKAPGQVAAHAPLSQRTNCVFMGTSVRSGTAQALVVRTGGATAFGSIAHRLALRPPETEFDRGLRRFGYLLTSAMLVLVLAVFAIHVIGGRPPVETLLFAVALAVGLSPELLPAVLGVNLARSAQSMAEHGVLVRRLNAIENLGSMDVLCTDKTGTLTEGVVSLEAAVDPDGQPSSRVLTLAALNASFGTGVRTPLDDAILARVEVPGSHLLPPDVRKVAEVPFDFVRKRVSVVVTEPTGVVRLITKGAVRSVLAASTHLADHRALDAGLRGRIDEAAEGWGARGVRVVAVASRELAPGEPGTRDAESGLTFEGFLTFVDRPKAGVNDAVADLRALGVAVKVITGDTGLVATHVAAAVGLRADRVLTGGELRDVPDAALWRLAEDTDIFAEVDPNQKERIILALKKTGHVVGFLGDGVNDVPAMHAADTSLSVDRAVDVAREAADFVLLDRDLDVIRRGIVEGRRTFANTLKYVLTTMSANLGNMISMAGASLILPFLPLLPSQILLNNFLSDVPAIGVADDAVDPEMVARPERWDMGFIARFMVEFGLVSSLFDAATFAVLLFAVQAGPELFRTAWFVESLLTELVIALVVRTRRPFFRSRPGHVLASTTAGVAALTLVLPYVPFAGVLGFVPIPAGVVAALAAITVTYVMVAELAKQWFFRAGR